MAINETACAVVHDKVMGPKVGAEDLAAKLNGIAQRNNYTGTTES